MSILAVWALLSQIKRAGIIAMEIAQRILKKDFFVKVKQSLNCFVDQLDEATIIIELFF